MIKIKPPVTTDEYGMPLGGKTTQQPGTFKMPEPTVTQQNTGLTPNWQPTFNLPALKYGDFSATLANIGQRLEQSKATTGQPLTEQARGGLYLAGLDVGSMQASEAQKMR